MRVAVIASSRFPIREPFAGGLEAHTHALAEGLRTRGHAVEVFASEGSGSGLTGMDVLSLSPEARSDLSMPSENFMREHHAYLRLMLDLSGSDFDVVQNSSLHYLPVAMAPALSAPVVTTLHTPPTPWMESALRCSGGAAVCVSVSGSNARSWRGTTKVREVIPNGIDLDLWAFSPRPESEDLAVWSGRIVPEKGPHLAVLAARRAGLRIGLAGPIGDRDYFEREVAPLLGPRAEYVGHLRQGELAELVGRAAVALCTPRWPEPYGLVVAEALACGTPVAAFDRGAMREVLDRKTGRLARPDSAAELARAALEARDLDRTDCRRRAETHCSLGAMTARYERLYRELLAARSIPAAG